MPKDERPKPPDMDLVCDNASCGKTFIFTGGEQNFYSDKGLDPPALCKECRTEKKAQQNVTIECEACGNKRIIRKEHIIRFRRKEGPWENPKYCKFCEENPLMAMNLRLQKASAQLGRDFFSDKVSNPRGTLFTGEKNRQGQKILRDVQKRFAKLLLNVNFDLSGSELSKVLMEQMASGIQPLEGANISEYNSDSRRLRPIEELTWGNKYTTKPPKVTTKTHIWGDNRFEQDYGIKLENHRQDFQDMGLDTFEKAMQEVDRIIGSKNPQAVVEVKRGNRILKFDLETGIFAIAEPYSEDKVRIVTAFVPEIGVKYILRQIRTSNTYRKESKK